MKNLSISLYKLLFVSSTYLLFIATAHSQDQSFLDFLRSDANAEKKYEKRYYLDAEKNICDEKSRAKYLRIKTPLATTGGNHLPTDAGVITDPITGAGSLLEGQLTDYYYPSMKIALRTGYLYAPYLAGNTSECYSGDATWYYENGTKKMEGHFEACAREGIFISYDKNGKITEKTKYVKGRRR